MGFPQTRMRRLRRTEALRRLVRETELSVRSLIYPLFVVPGEGVRKEVGSMPGAFHLSVDELVKECREVRQLGLPGVILFGLPEAKDELGS
ncbi:MAG: porphobilinogen synthase, partial [Acidobacteria bacterium]|nr:porphobilinogen synthase [Acidobacteriota bacterium]